MPLPSLGAFYGIPGMESSAGVVEGLGKNDAKSDSQRRQPTSPPGTCVAAQTKETTPNRKFLVPRSVQVKGQVKTPQVKKNSQPEQQNLEQPGRKGESGGADPESLWESQSTDGGCNWRKRQPSSKWDKIEPEEKSEKHRPAREWEGKQFRKPQKRIQFKKPSAPSQMGATKRTSNGEAKPIGPHPSIIRVSQPYASQAYIERRLIPATTDHHERSLAEAREDSVRLQGVAWLDNVRRSLQLPIRTYTTACVYYHKFRLAHPGGDYDWTHAAAASLLTACKVEDTLKKSRDILAAAWALRNPQHEPLGTDDPVFEGPCRLVIGLERLVLESSGFDFRSSQSHPIILKLCKRLPDSSVRDVVTKTAWAILTDLHRTFAPLKQTSSTLAIASIQLASHLQDLAINKDESREMFEATQQIDPAEWSTTREEVMETLLDGLDLYTQHTTSTILGTKFSLDDFLRIRLVLNKECSESSIARHTTIPCSPSANGPTNVSVANGHPTPVSPPENGAQQQLPGLTFLPMPQVPESGGTLRFVLNPQLAADERTEVQKYFTEEWEEYEEEIEVPIPRAFSRERERDPRDSQPPPRFRDIDDRSNRGYNSPRAMDRPPPPPHRPRNRFEEQPLNRFEERDRARESERERPPPEPLEAEVERERIRPRERHRHRRFEERRFDDRPRGRYEDRPAQRFDERRFDDRERGRYGGRYEDERRRR